MSEEVSKEKPINPLFKKLAIILFLTVFIIVAWRIFGVYLILIGIFVAIGYYIYLTTLKRSRLTDIYKIADSIATQMSLYGFELNRDRRNVYGLTIGETALIWFSNENIVYYWGLKTHSIIGKKQTSLQSAADEMYKQQRQYKEKVEEKEVEE